MNAQDKQDLAKKTEEYLMSVLASEDNTVIKRPMHPECKIAVVISAYREEPETLLALLESFSVQENVSKDFFEIDIVVANKKREAVARTPGFLINQADIKLLRYLSGESIEFPKGCNALKPQADKIKQSGLAVNVINKSTDECADEIHFASVGRNRAGAEAVLRFIAAPAGFNGIIATIDCDCVVSLNYIAEIINTYSNIKNLNGLSGAWKFDFNSFIIPHMNYFRRAYEVCFLKAYGIGTAGNNFKKGFESKKGALCFASNMTAKVSSWVLAGGVPQIVGSEDVVLGNKLDLLEGTVGVNYNYFVKMTVRFSDRLGARGDGKVISLLSQGIVKYFSGEADGIFYQNWALINNFFNRAKQLWAAQQLTGERMSWLMREHNFDCRGFTPELFEEFAVELGKHFGHRTGETGSPRYAWLLDNKVHAAFPQSDITRSIVGPKVDFFYKHIMRRPAINFFYRRAYKLWFRRELRELRELLEPFVKDKQIL